MRGWCLAISVKMHRRCAAGLFARLGGSLCIMHYSTHGFVVVSGVALFNQSIGESLFFAAMHEFSHTGLMACAVASWDGLVGWSPDLPSFESQGFFSSIVEPYSSD